MVIYFKLVKLAEMQDLFEEANFDFANPSFRRIMKVNSFKTMLVHNFKKIVAMLAHNFVQFVAILMERHYFKLLVV
jgi:hypothetical protein